MPTAHSMDKFPLSQISIYIPSIIPHHSAQEHHQVWICISVSIPPVCERLCGFKHSNDTVATSRLKSSHQYNTQLVGEMPPWGNKRWHSLAEFSWILSMCCDILDIPELILLGSYLPVLLLLLNLMSVKSLMEMWCCFFFKECFAPLWDNSFWHLENNENMESSSLFHYPCDTLCGLLIPLVVLGHQVGLLLFFLTWQILKDLILTCDLFPVNLGLISLCFPSGFR